MTADLYQARDKKGAVLHESPDLLAVLAYHRDTPASHRVTRGATLLATKVATPEGTAEVARRRRLAVEIERGKRGRP